MKTFTICFTGISGSGKTTLANALLEELNTDKQKIQLIDRDVLRNSLAICLVIQKKNDIKIIR